VTRIAQIKKITDLDAFAAHCATVGAAIPTASTDQIGPGPGDPLATPFEFTDGSAGSFTVGNRFCVLPMEGWDGTADGAPTGLVTRRWERFGGSGAKLVWGGEAVAVDAVARANPHQLVIGADTIDAIAGLRAHLVDAHRRASGSTDGLVVGLQLTHSGRWSRPYGDPAPLTAFSHPVLDAKVGATAGSVLSDDDLDVLVDRFVDAAALAADAGFDFVDVKHCHGYLLHELLGARNRSGRYGGDLDGRAHFLARVIDGIRARRPSLAIGVRLSAFDLAPFAPGPDNRGAPVEVGDLPTSFGGRPDGLDIDLTEVHAFVDLLDTWGVGLVCVTGGSPYYNPHIQRPAYFPPSDGYAPPNDPLVDVARHLAVTAELTHAHPRVAFVGSGYSYIQDFVAPVARAVIANGDATSIGLGRMMLSYPELPTDVLAGSLPDRRRICRTFSDCTTAPRHGMVSGCYPLDGFYKQRPERRELARVKKQIRTRLGVIAEAATPAADDDASAQMPPDDPST
jgi:2,4-dienoyl-CoA reductase-like NADH-dependent reductase (Old Yellow Enzyme family)